MHRIPRLYFCDVLGWKTSIKSLSIFELLIYISQIIIQCYLYYNAFPVARLPGYFCKSTTTGLVEIDMVPIYHTYAPTLRYVNVAIISDYIDILKSLIGVTGPLIRDLFA